MELFRIPWNLLELCRNSWNLVENCMESHGISMEHHGMAWNIIELEGTLWNMVEFSRTFHPYMYIRRPEMPLAHHPSINSQSSIFYLFFFFSLAFLPSNTSRALD